MLFRSLLVGLGTDAYTNDMFESMKVANILLAHNACDPTKGFGETLELQFKNNPKILAKYFQKPLGVIEKGAYADIITLDYDPITPFTKDNWGGHSLFGFTGKIVNDTIILEIKAVEFLVKDFEYQLINYLRATDIEVGLLLNFGNKPEFRRKVFSNERKRIRENG